MELIRNAVVLCFLFWLLAVGGAEESIIIVKRGEVASRTNHLVPVYWVWRV